MNPILVALDVDVAAVENLGTESHIFFGVDAPPIGVATHHLAEGAGAASLAAAVKLRDRLRGKRVVCVMSGGNIDRATLSRILAAA